jgi:hypothetical protein
MNTESQRQVMRCRFKFSSTNLEGVGLLNRPRQDSPGQSRLMDLMRCGTFLRPDPGKFQKKPRAFGSAPFLELNDRQLGQCGFLTSRWPTSVGTVNSG